MKRHICLAQINYISGEIERHEEGLRRIISDNRKSDLIIFPELILHGHPSKEKPEGFTAIWSVTRRSVCQKGCTVLLRK